MELNRVNGVGPADLARLYQLEGVTSYSKSERRFLLSMATALGFRPAVVARSSSARLFRAVSDTVNASSRALTQVVADIYTAEGEALSQVVRRLGQVAATDPVQFHREQAAQLLVGLALRNLP